MSRTWAGRIAGALTALVVSSCLGAAFAFWQLRAVSPAFQEHAPLSLYLPSACEAALAVLCLCALARLIVAACRRVKDPQHIAVEHLLPAAIIAVTFTFLIVTVSPLYLDSAVFRYSAELNQASSSIAMREFLNACRESFSDFTPGYWGAAQDVPTSLSSLVLGVIAFLHLFPCNELSSFFKILSLIEFTAYVAASYFVFRLLRLYGLRYGVALAAALVYVTWNRPMFAALAEDGPYYLIQYLVIPAALYALTVAMRTGSYRAAAWCGAALASQFYILAPHPEATIYSVLIIALAVLAHWTLAPADEVNRTRVVKLGVVVGATFAVLSAAYMLPMVGQMARGDLLVLGHRVKAGLSYRFYVPVYYLVALVFFAPLALPGILSRRANPLLALSTVLVIGVLLMCLPVVPAIVEGTAQFLHLPIRLAPEHRVMTWLAWGALFIVAFGTDRLIDRLAPRLRSVPLQSTLGIAIIALLTVGTGDHWSHLVGNKHALPPPSVPWSTADHLRIMGGIGPGNLPLGAAPQLDTLNSSHIYDTRVYLGFPLIKPLFMYPPGAERFDVTVGVPDVNGSYVVSNRRFPWSYRTKEIFADSAFRKLLNIAGVQAYVTTKDAVVLSAVGAADSGLELIPDRSATTGPQTVEIRDRRAYDVAYLAHVVGRADDARITAAETATREYHHGLISDAPYEAAVALLRHDLLHLERKGDTLIDAPAEIGSDPAAKGGTVAIDGAAGPRIGLKVFCPDPTCWMVYTLAALPEWKAYIDGARARIARANYAFLAVPVPRGDHYVALVYVPLTDTVSALLSLMALVLVLYAAVPRVRTIAIRES